MTYLEMSRDEEHGGGSWEFGRCVWAPTQKEMGGQWPFWNKILNVREGDVVIHLRGRSPHAKFVGYSIAAASGFETTAQPPASGTWSFSRKFFRADLRDYTSFHLPIHLSEVFHERKALLEAYLERRATAAGPRPNVFYVKQAGRLQCLNGAYFSDLDSELFSILFEGRGSRISEVQSTLSIPTDEQLTLVKARIGQSNFSGQVKLAFGFRCCFPDCEVSDERFLVGAHIARWSDNPELRGHLGNGLCLCLMHDKAFELGLFTVDENGCVFVNPREAEKESASLNLLSTAHGKPILSTSISLLEDALLEHWNRVDITPTGQKAS
jgi:putative restriction endonuclease